MINLLPPNDKKQILAGLSNTLIARYCISSLLLALPLLLLLIGVYILMANARMNAESTIAEGTAKSSQYADIKSQSQEFSNNLSIAKNILDKEVRYSKIAVAIAQALPAGMSLENINLDAKSFGQPITLNVAGGSYEDAVKFKGLLSESTTFQDVHLQSVTQQEGGGVTIALSVVINPEVAKL